MNCSFCDHSEHRYLSGFIRWKQFTCFYCKNIEDVCEACYSIKRDAIERLESLNIIDIHGNNICRSCFANDVPSLYNKCDYCSKCKATQNCIRCDSIICTYCTADNDCELCKPE